MIPVRISSLFAISTLALTTLLPRASAHEVWIEDTPEGKLVVRFAEYGEKYEQSPGALDALTLPFAWTAAASVLEKDSQKPAASIAPGAPAREQRDIRAGQVTAFEVQKKSDNFLLVNADPAKPAQIETGFTVMGKQGDSEKPARKPNFYARWEPAGLVAGTPALNFDLVPTGQAGEVGLYFRGKPIAGVKVKLYPPAEAEQELTTDDKGFVHFTATKPGLYLLAAARYREDVSGFFGGKGYDVTSHNCSLAWRQK